MRTRLFCLGLIALCMFFVSCDSDNDDSNTLPKTEAELKASITKKWDISSNNEYSSLEFMSNGTYVITKQNGETVTDSYTIGSDLKTLTLANFGTITLVNLTANNLSFTLKPEDGGNEISFICTPNTDDPNTLPTTEAELKTNITKKWDIDPNDNYKNIEFKSDGTYVVTKQNGEIVTDNYTIGSDLKTLTLVNFGTITLVNLTAENLSFTLKLTDGGNETSFKCTPNTDVTVETHDIIVFTNNENDDNVALYIRDIEGKNVNKIYTAPEGFNIHGFDVAVDGSKIIFSLEEVDVNYGELYSMDIDGSNIQKLNVEGNEVAISTDGTKIAFCRDWSIYTCSVNGANETLLFEGSEKLWANSPSWTPDNKSIVYSSTTNGKSTALNIMNADGSEKQVLFDNDGSAYRDEPKVSPDGKSICYETNEGLAICDIDGKNENMILEPKTDYWALDPVWSPDGKSIYFGSYTTAKGKMSLKKINIDGTGLNNFEIEGWVFRIVNVEK